MFQPQVLHNHAPGRPPGASTASGPRAQSAEEPKTLSSSTTSGSGGQAQEERSVGAGTSRLSARSPRSRRKASGGGSAPSTPRGERDKSRDRSSKASTLDGRSVSGGGGGERRTGGGGGLTSRTTRSLNRTHSKLSSTPPTSSASSRAFAEIEAELSVDARAPGVIKLFGESVVQGAQYKAVLASTRSTSQELVKQALERYGLPPDTYPQYVLCDAVGVVSHPCDTDDAADTVSGHAEVDDNSDPSYASIGAVVVNSTADPSVSGSNSGAKKSGWTPVSMRILDNADRPLELQMYWKPPEGLSRRFELHRRNDVIRETSVDDTSGLNDNARRIMMSKVPPGAIPPLSLPLSPVSPKGGRRFDANGARTGSDSRGVQPLSPGSDSSLSKASPESEVKFAFVCPSIYPYLLTLRGHDIQKDLVLYPLKSKTLTVGRNHTRSHVDDIGLLADDIQDLHCRIHLKTLSSDTSPRHLSDRRRYWYCLHVEVIDRAVVHVNGQRVEQWATVQPGDLLGLGHHYLFLYKDPTGGHDIPDTLPWYPGAAALYAKVNKPGSRTAAGSASVGPMDMDTCEQNVLRAMVDEFNNQEYFDLDAVGENDSTGEVPLTVAYPREREGEVLEHIANISCSSPSDFPLTTTVLMMACHGYASRRFPPSHQAGFFRRLLRAIRNRVSVVSKALSVQKYQSNLYVPATDSQADDSRDGDPLLELLCWLSNVVRIYNHINSPDFRSRLATPQPPSDVIDSVQELCDSLEEMISFMFQQTVYSITKVLFSPVAQILHPPNSTCHTDNSRAMAGMERVLHVLRTTLDVSEDVSLHRDVVIQLLTYLVFFVTTTLFNKLMSKGPGSKQFCWSVGVRLQACVSSLEDWVSSVGLEAQYLRVSERLLSLVDLLATSRHTLLRMDWPSFRKQYSPLSETQLLKVLTEYQFSDGQTAPASWLPPPGVLASDEVTISLSSHPPFALPRQGPGVNLKDAFPPPLHRHLEAITRLFSQDAGGSYSDRSSSDPGTQRPSDPGVPTPRVMSSQGTFFTSDQSPTISTHRSHSLSRPAGPPPLPPPQHKVNGNSAQDPQSPPIPQRHKPRDDESPPPLPPKLPPRASTIQFADPPVQPFPEHRVTGVLSPRTPVPGGGTMSPRTPIPGPADYAKVLGPNARNAQNSRQEHLSASVSEAGKRNPVVQDRARHESVPLEPLTQSAMTPHYSVPSNQNRSQDHRDRSGSRSLSPPPRNPSHEEQQSHPSSKRQPPPYHIANSILQNKHLAEEKRLAQQGLRQKQDSRVPPEAGLTENKNKDPRRRPVNGVIVANGPLSLQDKRLINNVPPLEIPSEDLSGTTSDSAVSDDVFIQMSTDVPSLTRGSSITSSDFRRFSTGMLSKERLKKDGEENPEVVQVDMCEDVDSGHVTVEKYPDDIYIDVLKEVPPSGSARQLKVLPLDDGASNPLTNGYESDPSQSGETPPRVRYRHRMPQERDSSTKGEITGEVFTLTLLKEGSRLGMGLIDGMYTPLKLPGIYVRNVLPGTPAALCGHIRVGDRILAVNGRSIVGADYNSAMKLIRSTGPRLNLLIAKCDRSVTARISAS